MKRLHFLYHELRSEPSQYLYVVSCEEFRAHLQTFASAREQSSSDRLRPEITFDDGNVSDCRFALPLLQEAGLQAHFFITAGWTDQRAGFMSAAELRELHKAGMSVGAHGWSHKLLTACSDAELKVELGDAKTRLEDALGAPVKTMSLPGGRSNRRILRACREAGYDTVFTSEPRISDDSVTVDGPEFTRGRLNVRGGTTTVWLREVLAPETGALARLQRSDRVKGLAKSILGDGLYEKIWALANRQGADPGEVRVIP